MTWMDLKDILLSKNKSISKGQTLYDSIQITFPKWEAQSRRLDWVVALGWIGGGEGCGHDYKGVAEGENVVMDTGSGVQKWLPKSTHDRELDTHIVPMSDPWCWYCIIIR